MKKIISQNVQEPSAHRDLQEASSQLSRLTQEFAMSNQQNESIYKRTSSRLRDLADGLNNIADKIESENKYMWGMEHGGGG